MITIDQAWHIFWAALMGGFVLGALFSIAVYHSTLEKAERQIQGLRSLLRRELRP
jgi:hypothetical protein